MRRGGRREEVLQSGRRHKRVSDTDTTGRNGYCKRGSRSFMSNKLTDKLTPIVTVMYLQTLRGQGSLRHPSAVHPIYNQAREVDYRVISVSDQSYMVVSKGRKSDKATKFRPLVRHHVMLSLARRAFGVMGARNGA